MKFIGVEQFSAWFVASLVGIGLRSSILIVISALLAFCFRSRSAETRELLWRAALYGLLLFPPLELALFLVPPPVPASSTELHLPQIQTRFPGRAVATAAPRMIIRHANSTAAAWTGPEVATVVYLVVMIILLTRLGLSLWQIRKLIRRSEPIANTDLRDAALDAWLQSLSPMRPQVRISSDVRVPVAVHAGDRVILLPDSCHHWHADKVRAVLLHEMAHLRRNDPAAAALASLAVCLFWIHPLAYWLRRQLSMLAEEAADEAAVEWTGVTAYSRALTELSATVSATGQRLLLACGVVADRSRVKRRLEKIYSMPAYSVSGHRWAQAAILLILCPILFLSASTGVEQAPAPITIEARRPMSIASNEQALAVESELTQDPENLQARVGLMDFYANRGDHVSFAKHGLWMIEHHPDHPAAAVHIYGSRRERDEPGERDLLKAAWESALARQGPSPDVLHNAGLFFETDDPQRSMNLFRRAIAMVPRDPTRQQMYTHSLATIYGTAALVSADPQQPDRLNNIELTREIATQLVAELGVSTDAQLVAEVGSILVHSNRDSMGLACLQRAVDLDPSNPAWASALESAKAEPARRQNRATLAHSSNTNAVRVSAAVADANVLTAPEPEYPPLARQAGVEGDVEFSVQIGPDGHVQQLELVRGKPLLVNAAKNAVLGRTYRPTLLNGNPVAISTIVTVPFRLP